MRIMIVDDNAAMRKVLVALFVNAGHEVVGVFTDGDGIEDRIRQTPPDLVCLDYHMPGRDGLTVLRAIHAEAPEIDVIFMTASSDAGIEAAAADAGASGFIRKPFGQRQIIDELRAVGETRRKARQGSAAAAFPFAAGGAAVERPRGRRGTAVVADDNGSVRLVLRGLLEECGLQVVQSVANGAEAVEAASLHQPRVLCLDINMPVMDGIESLSKIVEVSPDTKVIMITGCADKKRVAQSAGLGAVGYIIKPLRPAYVEEFILKLLG